MACQPPLQKNSSMTLIDLPSSSLTNSNPVDPSNPLMIDLPKSVVYLEYHSPSGSNMNTSSCNGVLLAPFKILTAAHCFYSDSKLLDSEQIPSKSHLTIQYGDTTSNSSVMNRLSGKHIQSIELHRDFFRDQKNKGIGFTSLLASRSDLALITLEPNQLVNTVHFDHFKKLPDFYQVDDGTFDKTDPSIYGYSLFLAYTFFSDYSGMRTTNASLKFTLGLPALNISKVEPAIIIDTVKHFKNNNFNIGVCNGDSGSPLFYKLKNSNSYILVGIVSSAFQDKTQNTTCSDSAVFSLILNNRSWLNY